MNLDDMDFEEKEELAERSTDPEVLEQLSKDDYVAVRRAVARNENCPPHVLIELSTDDSAYVRYNVAENKNCPPYTLEEP